MVGAVCRHGRKRPAQLRYHPERRPGTLWTGFQRCLRPDGRQDHAAQARGCHDCRSWANCCASTQARAPCCSAKGYGDRTPDRDTTARCATLPSFRRVGVMLTFAVGGSAVRRFEGQVLILYHNTTMQPNYQAMLHCGVRFVCHFLYLQQCQLTHLRRRFGRQSVLFPSTIRKTCCGRETAPQLFSNSLRILNSSRPV